MAIALAGSNGQSTATSSSSYATSVSWGGGHTSSGNIVACVFQCVMNNVTGTQMVSSVTDTAGNTWHYSVGPSTAQNPPYGQVASVAFDGEMFAGVAWTFQDVGTVTSVTLNVTSNFTGAPGGGPQGLSIAISEWSGVGSVEAASAASVLNTSGNLNWPAISLTDSGDVWLWAYQFDGSNETPTLPGSTTAHVFNPPNTAGLGYTFPGATSASYAPFLANSSANTSGALAGIAMKVPASPAAASGNPERPLIVTAAVTRASNW